MSFSGEQKQYLEGFFAGTRLRGQTFGDVEATPQKEEPKKKEKLSKEEKIKRELHPLDAYPEIRRKASLGLPPEGGDVFRFKSNGLFWLNPVEDGIGSGPSTSPMELIMSKVEMPISKRW